ncbi:MAG: glycerophosphodiester phosphodiesterase family protein [Steroidobacteraceae bacterium]|jgi:glycerophosphoryl diester phosphodiesterase|nr:glycerophosphodiester phosphodiesterase family protein [Steroidobacteraceae bacterium]
MDGPARMSAPAHFTHLVSHRGNAASWPENTLPALASACEHGVRFLLVDVQLTGDETPVLLREPELARIADVGGTVFDLAGRDLEHLELRDAVARPGRSRGLRLARLAELSAWLVGRPDLTVFLEIARDSLARFGGELAIGRVLEAIRGTRAQCVLAAADLAAVQLARVRSNGRVGWRVPAYDAHARLKFEALRPDFLLVEAELLPTGEARLWRGPWRWLVSGVEQPGAAVALAARGADYVATAQVARLGDEFRHHARG